MVVLHKVKLISDNIIPLLAGMKMNESYSLDRDYSFDRIKLLSDLALSSPNIADDTLPPASKLQRVEFGSRSLDRTCAIALTVLLTA